MSKEPSSWIVARDMVLILIALVQACAFLCGAYQGIDNASDGCVGICYGRTEDFETPLDVALFGLIYGIRTGTWLRTPFDSACDCDGRCSRETVMTFRSYICTPSLGCHDYDYGPIENLHCRKHY